MGENGLTDWVIKAPEEYPKNLGLLRPDFLRANFDHAPVVEQAHKSYRIYGYIQLIAYWGVGWRDYLTSIDRIGMAHLAAICTQLEQSMLRGTRLTLLLSDNHGLANEIPAKTIQAYYSLIENLACEFSFDTRRLSTVFPISQEFFTKIDPTPKEISIFEEMRPRLERSARNLHPDNFENRARQYFFVRYRESSLLQKAYPNAILANSDMLDRSVLAPELPSFWIYALPGKRWRKYKPWFMHQQFSSMI
jgi:hypothetical protein